MPGGGNNEMDKDKLDQSCISVGGPCLGSGDGIIQSVWDGVLVPLKSHVQSLGVLLYIGLSLEPQVSTMSKVAFFTNLGWSFYMGLPLKTIWKLPLDCPGNNT